MTYQIGSYHFDRYAKEEAIAAIMKAYIKANIDVFVTCAFNGCTLGNNAVPNSSISIPKGSDVVEKIDCITLKYRMNINNSPFADENGISCQLSFAGKFILTYVPYVNILAITTADNPNFSISFPYIGEYTESKEDKPVENKKKSFLKIVK